MFLATSGLTELWDTSDELLLLGPWCLRYDRRAEWQGLNYRVLRSPWEDPRAVERAEEYCDTVMAFLLASLGDYLNETHGVRRSRRYWRILVGSWLLYYVHALYDRYVSLRGAFESHGDLKTAGLISTAHVTPADTREFVSLAYVKAPDLFNLQLYSQILDALDFKAIIWKDLSSLPEAEYVGTFRRARVVDARSGGNLRQRAAAQAVALLARMVRPRVMLGEVGLGAHHLLSLIRAMAFRGRALVGPLPMPGGVDHIDEGLRAGLGNIPGRDEFTRVVVQTLRTNCPVRYLEGYATFREACLKMWPYRPDVLVSSIDWVDNEAFKFVAAESGEHGSRLVGMQHGAGYGTSKVIPQEKHELFVTDRWLSYGWVSRRLNGKVQPVPHPRFLPYSARRVAGEAETPGEVLLVTTSHPRYPFRFESHPCGGFDVVLEWRNRFIRALPSGVGKRLVVRLHSEDFGWYQKQRLADSFGDLRLADGKSSARRLFEGARLVVLEYFGTAFLEVLAANVPSILFLDAEQWRLRDEAAPYFEGLRKAGVVVDSPEAAAAKVVEVHDKPWGWWASHPVQEARGAFVDRYALGRKDWLECWVRILEEEIALSRSREK